MDVKIYKKNFRRSNFRTGGFVLEVKKHSFTILLYILVLGGLITGSIFIKESQELFNQVKSVFENFITNIPGQTLFENFIMQLTINSCVLLLNFIFGLCAIGLPIPFMLSYIKGFCVGIISSFLYSEYNLKGFGFCMLVLFPVQIITALLLIFSGKESACMSLKLLKTVTEQNFKNSETYELKKYISRNFLLLIVTVIASFISALLNIYIVRLFDF